MEIDDFVAAATYFPPFGPVVVVATICSMNSKMASQNNTATGSRTPNLWPHKLVEERNNNIQPP